jgi:ectoine hydroxylase-related dioxygenase (phytanoyl-CoA dioxygenase family)
MQQTVKTFGVKEFSRPATELERHVEEIKLAGYTVLAGVLSPEELDEAREKIDRIYQMQLDEIGGNQHLEAINDTYNARCLLAYDDFFLKVARHQRVLEIVERLLGDYFTLMLQNGVINVPVSGDEQNAGYWHRDLNYQHFVSTRPVSISALICVDHFSTTTGGTRVLPGSHKSEAFPSEEFVLNHETGVEAEAGSAIVFDSMLFHRGGHNRSSIIRRAINHMYTIPFIKQQISLPKILKGRFSDDPFLSKFLGYESEPNDSVIEFRARRLKRVASSPTDSTPVPNS